ncbi:radical SAM protein [Nonomuraea sp. MG754425]|uniref:radical SAM protein n=1 Tax=Nonomuraea sp. MG754425 TaxID=2570319 RepID=UPI001F020E18|nr:radical SAM protein [Nonomuraea sp. MG754425]
MTTFDIIPPERKQQESIMPYVTFPLINVCTQKCVYCGDGAEMTLCNTRQFKADDLLDWHRAARTLGVEKFRITGGETLLHRDFHRIVHTVAADASEVLINTNGTLLKRFPKKWKDSPRNCHYVVNMHGATEEVYDRVSATKGYYPVVREGIEMLADAGLLHRLNAVLNRYNQDEIWGIIDICREVGTNLKIQDVVSVPWSFHEWSQVHVDSVKLEQELEARASRVREHKYARSFGTPTKIYTIDGVNVTLKSVRNGSQYDMEGICKSCPFFPCHEGVYDIFIFADNTAWACNWTDIAKARTTPKEDQLAEMIALFQRATYVAARKDLEELRIKAALPPRSQLKIIDLR